MGRNLYILAATLVCATCLGQTPSKRVVLNAPVTQRTAVKFYWFGDMWSHWREPMTFYVVDEKDPKFHTLIRDESLPSAGWRTSISISEMEAMLRKLADSDLEWTDSKKIEDLAKPTVTKKNGVFVIQD